ARPLIDMIWDREVAEAPLDTPERKAALDQRLRALLNRIPYEKFDEVIVTHTCREVAELEYSMKLVEGIADDPLVGEEAPSKLKLYTSCTREDHPHMGRVTDLITSGKLFEDLGVPKLDPATDRAMICGSMEMINDTKALMIEHGLNEGSNNAPAEFVIEKAFSG
ncbi:MAG: hypothetical protein AAF225_06220, partial [Pseudomonadota bacterium]